MRGRLLPAVVAACLFSLGVLAAAGTSGVSNCHPSWKCGTSTTTATTTTTTTPATSTATTTTAPTTTTTVTDTAPTFASETSYTQNRPAFTATRTVSVSSASQLRSAIANLRPGDLVKASAPFTVANPTSTSNGLVISNRLSSPAVIDLTGVTVEYTGTGQYNSVWVKNVLNIRIYGGNVTMTQPTLGGGSCISWTASQHSLWWGFEAYRCGSSGMGIFTSSPSYSYGGPISYDDIEGTVHDFSLNHGMYDNHQEKCTGLHGANIADNNWYSVDHNRFALDVYNSPCIGGGIEFGASKSPTTSPPGPIPDSNTIILQCANFTFVSTIQTGGNCLQQWGYGDTRTDVKYLNASNLTGHPYWAGGMYNKGSATYLSTDKVEYGRAVSVRQNPRYASDPNWDKREGTVFLDVAPLP